MFEHYVLNEMHSVISDLETQTYHCNVRIIVKESYNCGLF